VFTNASGGEVLGVQNSKLVWGFVQEGSKKETLDGMPHFGTFVAELLQLDSGSVMVGITIRMSLLSASP
jgi:hypothetical protein